MYERVTQYLFGFISLTHCAQFSRGQIEFLRFNKDDHTCDICVYKYIYEFDGMS